MKFKITRTNKKLENEGVWIPVPENGDLEFKIARDGNHKSSEFAASLFREQKYKKVTTNPKHAKKLAKELENEIIVEHILLDWKGMLDEDDNDVEYSKETVKTLLEDEELHDIRDWIIRQSKDMDHFLNERLDEEIEQAKKS